MAEKTITFQNETPSAELASFVGVERQTSSSKQTSLALPSEFSVLRETEEIEKEFKDSTPVSTSDSGGDTNQGVHSREGVAIFRSFDNHVNSLDRQLQAFGNAVRQLGSSVGLLNATYHLRGALLQIEHLFRENAADLFSEIKRKMERAGITRMHVGVQPQLKSQKDLELLPEEMDTLAEQIHVFVHRLNDIPEFTDELVNASFLSFASDLKYRASCLREYKGQIKTIAVQRYINDLSVDIGTQMEGMKEALHNFIEVGVPAIRHTQNHTANGLQYLSTVAALVSGVTSTTIQYSFDQTGNPRADLVNGLWIISLIFSIASAINSQLAYHWRAAMYRSPRNFVPWWVSIWIERLPLFFLIGSVVAFSVGLSVFTFSSHQNPLVSVLVTAFTIVTSSGLVSVGLWFMSERWIFSHARGQRWLFDIINETQTKIHKAHGITWVLQRRPKNICSRITRWWRVQLHNIMTGLRAIYAFCTCRSVQRQIDEEKQGRASDFAPPSNNRSPPVPRSDLDAPAIADTAYSSLVTRPNEKHPRPSGFVIDQPPSYSGLQQESASTTAHIPPLPIVVPEVEQRLNAKRLKSVVKRVIALNRLANTRMSPQGRENPIPPSFAQKARLRELKLGLGNLQLTRSLNEHMALVKHMQFSPNGEFLATCSWDHTAIIWSIADTVELSMRLRHPVSVGGFVNQVEWSPDGEKLLTRTQKAITIWDPFTGIRQPTSHGSRSVQSVSWMPSGNGLLSVEYQMTGGENITGTNLILLDVTGQVLKTHTLERIQIWDTAIMADGNRVVAVGALLKSMDHLQPTQSRAEKRLLVYNMEMGVVEHHVPLLQEVHSVSLDLLDNKVPYALVSHDDKSPPQLWRIDMNTAIKTGTQVARLALVHSYLTQAPVDFAGQSSFGGPNGAFVCSSSKSGEIFIWDRTSATLLHTLRPDDSEVIKYFACNRKSVPGFMLVAGGLDRIIRIWSSGSSPFGTPDRRVALSSRPIAQSPLQKEEDHMAGPSSSGS